MINADLLIDIVKEAGNIILVYYHKELTDTIVKEDGSPLTIADKASHTHIVNCLKQQFQWPVLSEEDPVEYENRKDWKKFWLVDPLDGTKDFLAVNDEFTVNIALIENGNPVFGIIYAPALNEIYYAQKGQGAYFIENDKKIKLPFKKSNELIACQSRFHESKGNLEFMKLNKIFDVRAYGSSLKFGKLATGEISIYPRFIGSSEWDIAAGHIIVTEAGCDIKDLKTLKEPLYNKASIRNNYFIAHSKSVVFNNIKLPEDR